MLSNKYSQHPYTLFKNRIRIQYYYIFFCSEFIFSCLKELPLDRSIILFFKIVQEKQRINVIDRNKDTQKIFINIDTIVRTNMLFLHIKLFGGTS